jgi:hypothetical protein
MDLSNLRSSVAKIIRAIRGYSYKNEDQPAIADKSVTPFCKQVAH